MYDSLRTCILMLCDLMAAVCVVLLDVTCKLGACVSLRATACWALAVHTLLLLATAVMPCREQHVKVARTAVIGRDTAIGAGSSLGEGTQVLLHKALSSSTMALL